MPFSMDARSPDYRPPVHDRDEQKEAISLFNSQNHQADNLAKKYFPDLMPEIKSNDPTLLMGSEWITWQGEQLMLVNALGNLSLPAYMMDYSTREHPHAELKFDLAKAMKTPRYLELRAIVEKIIETRKVRWEIEKTARANPKDNTHNRWWHDK